MKPGSLALLAQAASGSGLSPADQQAVRTCIRNLVECGVEAIQMAGSRVLENAGEETLHSLRPALAEAVARFREREFAAYLGVSHLMPKGVDGRGLGEDRSLGIVMGICDALGRASGGGGAGSQGTVADALLDAGALPESVLGVASRIVAQQDRSGEVAHPSDVLQERYGMEVAAARGVVDGTGSDALDQDAFHRGQVIASHMLADIREEIGAQKRFAAARAGKEDVTPLQGTALGVDFHRMGSSGRDFRSMV